MPGKKTISLRYVVTVTLFGNTLQWYEYHIFYFLIPLFGQVFFPTEIESRFIFTLTLYGLNALGRLAGAFLFGFIGDEKGRRIALLISMSCMTLPMFGIALLPTFAEIGWTATVIFLCLRFMQGIAAGGELAGGMVYLIESSPPDKRGFYGSFAYFGVALAILIAYIDVFVLRSTTTVYNWRPTYLFGAVFGLIILFLRGRFQETHLFQSEKDTAQSPVIELLRNHKTNLLKTIGIFILDLVGFSLMLIFFLIYWNKKAGFPIERTWMIQSAGLSCLPFFIILAGKLSEIIGIRRQAAICSFALFCLSPPLLYWMDKGALAEQIFIFATILALLAGYFSLLPALSCSYFPTKIRYTGVSIGYGLTFSIFSGITPSAVLALSNWLPASLDMGLYLSAASLITFIALVWTRGKHLPI